MKKLGLITVVVGMLASQMALANDCPLHNQSGRFTSDKAKTYALQASNTPAPKVSSGAGVDGTVSVKK